MSYNYKNYLYGAVACGVTSLCGVPALADDTELLLVNPGNSAASTPNVMFILDTSGSMASEEETVEPYDSTRTYTGSCASDRIYWTDANVTPSCDGGNTRSVNKSSFHCQAAARQIEGIGSFSSTMVQYRADLLGLAKTWQNLEAGNFVDPVECQADSGIHGDGTTGQVYASALSGLLNPWTANQLLEISWGSSPRNVSYTVFDGNYLNWRQNPTTVTLSRNEIMRSVVSTVLRSLDNLNVGVMRFNERDGGVVLQSIKDLETNRNQILDVIDGLDANGFTPLSEALYESALYWNGSAAYYGQNIDEYTTDPDALSSTEPNVYRSPISNACAKNYNVLLTDGEPVLDTDPPTLVAGLDGYTSLLGRTGCNGTNEGACLDDIGEYLSLLDARADVPGLQNVTTHTIGFNIDLPILRDTAAASGGEYFLADDVESLTLALLQIVANINERSLSFAAPAVSVNTFNRTQNLNRLYLTVFGTRTNVHWPGNLKRYEINGTQIVDAMGNAAVNPANGYFFDTAQNFWSASGPDGNNARLGGAANLLPDPQDRNLYTNNGLADLTATSNQLRPSAADNYTDADFGLTGSDQDPTRADLIRWMRGQDIRDEDNNPATNIRYAMGDPLHSRPAAVVYGGTAQNPDVVVYTGTNDGYLHAIDGETGAELWSFVPRELLPNMARLFFDPQSSFKNYGIDGDIVPVVRDTNQNGVVDGDDFVYILFGMRRGGSSYYALDVTDKNNPEMVWNVSFPNSGQSWSAPVVARVDIDTAGQNSDKAVVIIADGYDPVHDSAAHPSTPDGSGAGLRMLDLQSGVELWRAGRTNADLTLSTMTRAIPTRVRVLDISGDGFADRMYAADLGGQVWRFDIANGESPANLVAGGVIAQLGAEQAGGNLTAAADTRRFYNTPDVSMFSDPLQDRRYLAISIGSGYRAHPFDLSAADRFYSLRDPDVFRQLDQSEYDNYDVISDDELVEVGGTFGVELGPADRGWRFTMPGDQKVLADSLTFDNDVFFVGFSPQSNAQTSCLPGGGTNFLYRVSVINGDPVVNNLDALDPADADDARRQELAQGGIAPSPTILFPSPTDPDCEGAACAPPPIGCVGRECFDPGFVNNPVRTLWSQDGIQ
jgi:type IV pilus assembly protein PilY1